MKHIIFRLYAILLIAAQFVLCSVPSQARDEADSVQLLRDAEIEDTLRDLVSPIMKTAGLDPQKLRIYLIKSPEINAAASTGPSLFMNSGLITRSENVGQVIGVLAHEVGHMAGGHVVRTEGVGKKLSLATLAAIALGAAVGAAASNGELASALALGGSHLGQQAFLHYSRGQEAAADHAAARYLDQLHWSSKGMAEFLKILEKQDLLDLRRQDPYRRTHPLTHERVVFFEHHVQQSPYTSHKWSDNLAHRYERMKIKLHAFIEPTGRILSQYPSSTTTVTGRLARAIALHRSQKPNEALATLESVMRENPDPYFIELKGQILFESGRVAEASRVYSQALSLKPHEDLIRIAYVQTLLEQSEDSSKAQQALNELHKVSNREKDNTLLWRLKATAYGRLQRMGMMALMLAEEAYARRDIKSAKAQAERALKLLSKQGEEAKARVRAEDILNDLTVNKDDDELSFMGVGHRAKQ